MQRDMNSPLVKFLLTHLAYGCVGGCALGGLILWWDFNGIGTMILRSRDMWLWIAMLFFGLMVTFGSVGMGVAVMSMGEERDWPSGEGPHDYRQ